MDAIIFPDQRNAMHLFDMKKGRNCVYSICSEMDGYPEEQIKSAINRNKSFDGYFDTKISLDIHIHNRVNLDSTEHTFCQTQPQITYPKIGTNIKNETRIIVNTEENIQIVDYDKCV